MSLHGATLEFDYESGTRARIVAESVSREIGEIDDERSRTTISRSDRTVFIEIEAADVIALRAALNTWFSLIDIAEETATAGKRFV
ncbi:KEOPS complex subunit Pcc1 [Halostagnicola bangensis]